MKEKPLAGSAKEIGFSDKLGYALGDMGIMATTALISSFLQVFYTDALYIPLNQVMVLFTVTRIWSAVSDPIWGAFVDTRRPSKHGKFRPYLIWFLVPHTVVAVALFTKVSGLSPAQSLIFAYVTYISYVMIDTMIGIPYGSLVSVISDKEDERSALSLFRSIGSGIGGIPTMLILPLFVYTKNADGSNALDPKKLQLAVGVLALVSVLFFSASFKMTRERVAYSAEKQEFNVLHTVRLLLKNRSFIAICLVAMLAIALSYFQNSAYQYLFKDYFRQPELYSLYAVVANAPTVLMIPFVGKLVRRFGKKELCSAGLLLSALSYSVLLVFRTQNPYVFFVFSFLAGLGFTFLSTQTWALAADAIDYHELLSGRREEGTSYAFFSFTRKLGHTVAGVSSTGLLSLVGYKVSEQVTVQSAEVIRGIYTISAGAPVVMYLLAFLLLAFVYPFNRQRLKEMDEQLAAARESRA